MYFQFDFRCSLKSHTFARGEELLHNFCEPSSNKRERGTQLANPFSPQKIAKFARPKHADQAGFEPQTSHAMVQCSRQLNPHGLPVKYLIYFSGIRQKILQFQFRFLTAKNVGKHWLATNLGWA